MKRKHKRLNKKVFLLFIILLLIAAGTTCYFSFGKKMINKITNKEKTKDNSSKKSTKKKEEEPKLQIVDTSSKERPFAVMINNLAVARPLQCGLQDAFIVYEIIVEGGITRYMAVFKDSNAECISTIRSARHYYLDYALENDAIYVHHGQSPQAQADFSNLKVDRIVASEPNTGWRDKSLSKSTEHTLVSSIEKIKKGLGSKRSEFTDERYKDNYGLLLHYSVKSVDLSAVPNAQVANKIDIKYSNSTTTNYEYDAEAKVYKRSVNNKSHVDRITKKQYTAKNIITYQVKNSNLNDGENKGRQDLHNVGEGTGWYISEGYAVPIKWSKSSRSSKTKYTLEDGTELKVNDGNTYIQIQPVGQKLNISE